MPLHLNSLVNGNTDLNAELLAHIVGPALQANNRCLVTQDKLHLIGSSDMVDTRTGKVIGYYIYTIWSNLKEQRNEILDLDIILYNEKTTSIRFLRRLPSSSDSNEYYDAETCKTEQHFQLETVCRYTVSQEIEATARNVYISAFPFELSIFDSISAFNRHIGFKEHHPIGKTDLTTDGLSETFLAPGNILSSKNDDETFSFVIGKVESYKDVTVNFGKINLDFVIAQVDTAFGNIPVAMGRDVFDIEKLIPGMIVAMNAYIKADLSNPEDFKS